MIETAGPKKRITKDSSDEDPISALLARDKENGDSEYESQEETKMAANQRLENQRKFDFCN